MIDRKRLVQTLVGVYGFYDKELTEFAIRIWAEALAEFDAASVETAFSQHVRDTDAGRFCPKPADIIKQIRGDVADLAMVEWGKVLEAARAGGARFDSPTQQALDNIGGMYALRVADESAHTFLQRQFIAAFKAYRSREMLPAIEHDVLQKIGVAHVED